MIPTFYIQIARDAINANFTDDQINRNEILRLHPEMGLTKATFVTLTLDGHLRGCIGSIIAHRPLLDDLISNAQSAAFHDPRFDPLSADEADKIKIEISLLSEPQPVLYRDAQELSQIIRPGIDGVILLLGNRQATFLPQVWDEIGDFMTFFAHLGLKAGIGSDPLSLHPDVYTYQVDKIKEE